MQGVNLVTQECFNALIQLRALGDEPQLAPQSFHARVVSFMDGIYAKAREQKIDENDAKEMVFALAALADEVALRKPGLRDAWMQRPLQYHYFGAHLAGEAFFQRLEFHISDPTKQHVLYVFYLCLLFGFQGMYQQRGRELELTAVIRRVQDALGNNIRTEPLSVHHQRPRERLGRKRVGLLTIWIGLFAILFSVAVIAVLKIELNRRTDSLEERVQAMLAEE